MNTVTDSAGRKARYTPIEDVRRGAVVLGGWEPFLVVSDVELDPARELARLRFEGGHDGGWQPFGTPVPVEVTE